MKDIHAFSAIANIEFFPDSNKLSEITQTMNLRYAFVNQDFKMAHPYVKCRDFLHDAIRGQLTNTAVSRYGFTYSPSKNPNIYLDRTIMLVEYPKTEEPKIQSAVSLLKYFEQELFLSKKVAKGASYSLTTASRVNVFDPNVYHVLFTSPKQWQSTPALISLYTLLIKIAQHDSTKLLNKENITAGPKNTRDKTVGSFFDSVVNKTEEAKEKGEQPPLEAGYLQRIRPRLYGFMNNWDALFEFEENGYASVYYDKSIHIGTFHDQYGIVGLLTGMYKGLPVNKLNELLLTEVKNKGLKISKNEDLGDTNVRFERAFAQDNPYGISFALVARENKNFRYITTSLTADRNGLIKAVKAKADKVKGAPALDSIDVEKLRLLVVSDRYAFPSCVEKLKIAKTVINKIEEAAGIEERTKISEAHLSFNTMHTKELHLLTGPGIWIKSPYLFFMFQTIISGITTANIQTKGADKVLRRKNGITDFLNYTAENLNGSVKRPLKLIVDKLPLVIDGIDLFTQDSLEKNYETLNTNKNVEGKFNSLFNLKLEGDTLNDALKEMWESKQEK